MSEILKQLEVAATLARRQLSALECAKGDEQSKLIDAAKDAIQKQMSDKHDAAIRVAREESGAAERRLNDEKDRIARTGEGAK